MTRSLLPLIPFLILRTLVQTCLGIALPRISTLWPYCLLYHSTSPPLCRTDNRTYTAGPVPLQRHNSPPLHTLAGTGSYNMLDNSSTSSLPSLLDERPERRKHQGWRKPVPKFIPDPPKRQSLLSNSSALRRMALLTSGDDRPPVSPHKYATLHTAAHVFFSSCRPTGRKISKKPSPTSSSTLNAPLAPPPTLSQIKLPANIMASLSQARPRRGRTEREKHCPW